MDNAYHLYKDGTPRRIHLFTMSYRTGVLIWRRLSAGLEAISCAHQQQRLLRYAEAQLLQTIVHICLLHRPISPSVKDLRR